MNATILRHPHVDLMVEDAMRGLGESPFHGHRRLWDELLIAIYETMMHNPAMDPDEFASALLEDETVTADIRQSYGRDVADIDEYLFDFISTTTGECQKHPTIFERLMATPYPIESITFLGNDAVALHFRTPYGTTDPERPRSQGLDSPVGVDRVC